MMGRLVAGRSPSAVGTPPRGSLEEAMARITGATLERMRSELFFEGEGARRKRSRFWLLLPLSGVIAAAGVVADSTATVIGAMIVAPLMVPILGVVLAVVLGDRTNLIRSAVLVIAGGATVIAIGVVMGLVVPVDVVAATNSQVAGRVSPRLVDLVAALATGAVGSVALVRDDIADTLPGVAIAISLVPPLAVVGLTLESGDAVGAAGAMLLFLTNVTAIVASGLVVMAAFGVRFEPDTTAGDLRPSGPARSRRTAAFVVVLSIAILVVPLAFGSQRITKQFGDEARVRNAVVPWAEAAGWDVVSVRAELDSVTVVATGPLPEPDLDDLDAALGREGVDGMTVALELVPSRRVQLER
jgi:uncharacterized hydrophobic protein (TIGR00271 family)